MFMDRPQNAGSRKHQPVSFRLGRRRPITALALGLAAFALAGHAAAAPSCEGTYSAMSLRPLPTKIVVGLDIHDRSPDHLRLAERFMARIRKAGVGVGPRPTVLLHISSSRPEEPVDRTANGVGGNYSDLAGLQGGIHLGLPAIPDAGLTTRAQPVPPPLLDLRIDATEGPSGRISCTAYMQCRMIGKDDGALAEELGEIVGGTLGQVTKTRAL